MRHAQYPRLEYTVKPIGTMSARRVLEVEQSLLLHPNPLLRRLSVLDEPTIVEPPKETFVLTTTPLPKVALRKPSTKSTKTQKKRRLNLH